MVDMTFVQDFRTGEWCRCYDERLCNEDISRLPWAIAIRYKKANYDLCLKSGSIESVADLSALSDFEGLFACQDSQSYIGYYDRKFIVPLRWRIHKGDAYHHIMLGVDCMILIPRAFGYAYGKWRGIHDYSLSLSIDVGKRKILAQHKDYMYGISGKNNAGLVSIPDNVLAEACRIMQDEAGRAFGIRPSVNIKPCDWEFIEKFVSRPFDVNIAYWERILGRGEYEKLFPWEQKDNFRPLCQYIGIEKPPGSLRKAYGENPYAPMFYMLMQDLGLQDINFIRKFLKFDKRIFGQNLCEFRFDAENGRFCLQSGDEQDLWQGMEKFCHFVLKRKSEKHLAKLLYRMSQASRDAWRRYIADAIDMFCRHADELSEDILKLVADKGMTGIVHDLLAVELRERDEDNVVIKYGDELLKLECMLDDYEFRLVHETRELHELGIKLYNCVESYRKKVLAGKSVICYVKRQNKYLACIEIKNQGTVVQAYAYNNQHMAGELLRHVLYWMQLKKLRLDVEYMSGVDVSDARYEERRLPHRHVSAMDYDELMAVSGEAMPEGWYTRFEELLPQQRAYHLSPPPWINIDGEDEYLKYALPEGERLIEAAVAENPEAMTALGVMYLQGKILLQDDDKARYWLAKAAKHYHYDRAWQYLMQMPQKWQANSKDDDERLAMGLAYLRTYGRVMD